MAISDKHSPQNVLDRKKWLTLIMILAPYVCEENVCQVSERYWTSKSLKINV